MSRVNFKSALIGALVGGLLAAGLTPVAAAIGDSLIIGQSNTAHAQTELRGNVDTQNLRVFNSNPAGTGLNIQVKPHNPPFVVNTSFKVKRLNADYVDGFNGTDLQSSAFSVFHDAAKSIPRNHGLSEHVDSHQLAGRQLLHLGQSLVPEYFRV